MVWRDEIVFVSADGTEYGTHHPVWRPYPVCRAYRTKRLKAAPIPDRWDADLRSAGNGLRGKSVTKWKRNANLTQTIGTPPKKRRPYSNR